MIQSSCPNALPAQHCQTEKILCNAMIQSSSPRCRQPDAPVWMQSLAQRIDGRCWSQFPAKKLLGVIWSMEDCSATWLSHEHELGNKSVINCLCRSSSRTFVNYQNSQYQGLWTIGPKKDYLYSLHYIMNIIYADQVPFITVCVIIVIMPKL